MLIFTFMSFFTSGHPYVIMLLCGVSATILTARSLSDKHLRPLSVLQLLLFLIFSALSGSAAAYLLLGECPENKAARVVLPASVYFVFGLLKGGTETARLILGAMILAAFASAAVIAERSAGEYIAARNGTARAVSVTAVNEMYVKKLNRELAMKNYLADKNARLEERENISRDIHNSVGHSITAAIMTLDAADMLFDTDPEKAREKMNAANVRIRGSLEAVRRAVRVLDGESGYVSVSDLAAGLFAVCEDFMTDTSVRIRADLPEDLPDAAVPREHSDFLTGALRELLSNGARHGGADAFTVSLSADSGHIKLTVRDNGTSDFSADNAEERIRGGFGLKKLRAYAERCGGSAGFENENGFASAIDLPLDGEGNE